MLADVVLQHATITSVQQFGGLQRLVVRSSTKVPAGSKVQVLLPSNDVRTYTPVPHADGMLLLGFRHAGGPGADWISKVRAADPVSFIGPQRSLELEAGPVVIVGDETSIAVAAAFAAERPGLVHAVIQGDGAEDIRVAASSLGLHQLDTVARDDTASTVKSVVAKLSTIPNSLVAVTGGSELIVNVRNALRSAGVSRLKTKTYWVPGKAGLD